jgi:methionyl-tRNA formyltransferase
MKKRLRIIFMGTPEFAVPSLKMLFDNGFDIPAVVTAPDKPSGRGLHMHTSPIKQFALQHGLNVLQPEKLKHPDFIEYLRTLQADLQVVVAFRMLPEVVWNMPHLGTINLHASILPDYRGAAPIHWAIINGEKKTGVTTFFLRHAIDTGDIIQQQSIDIAENETAGSLHDKLMHLGAELVLRTVASIENNTYKALPQPNTSLKIAPKIFKQDCQIDWRNPAASIKNFIHGLSPHPGAFTKFHNGDLKIFKAKMENQMPAEAPGTIVTDGKTYLKFAAADGYIYAEELQAEGRKKMLVTDFLRGYKK